jgi:hypothetical protein
LSATGENKGVKAMQKAVVELVKATIKAREKDLVQIQEQVNYRRGELDKYEGQKAALESELRELCAGLGTMTPQTAANAVYDYPGPFVTRREGSEATREEYENSDIVLRKNGQVVKSRFLNLRVLVVD